MSFLTSLTYDELQLLRRVVKQTHMAHYPQDLFTDREADRIIEAFGPSVKEKLLKEAIEKGMRT